MERIRKWENWWQNHISFEFPDWIIILTFFSRHVGFPKDWLQKFPKIRNAWVQSSQRFFVGNIFHAALNEMKIWELLITKNLSFAQILQYLNTKANNVYACVSAFGLCHFLGIVSFFSFFLFCCYHNLRVAHKQRAPTSQVRSCLMVETDQSSHVFMLHVCVQVQCHHPVADGYMSQNVTAPVYHLLQGKKSKALSYWIFLFFFFLNWAEIWTQPSRELEIHRKT